MRVIWSEYAFLMMVLYKLEIFLSGHLVVCRFSMFVMNKLSYSECVRLSVCVAFFKRLSLDFISRAGHC